MAIRRFLSRQARHLGLASQNIDHEGTKTRRKTGERDLSVAPNRIPQVVDPGVENLISRG